MFRKKIGSSSHFRLLRVLALYASVLSYVIAALYNAVQLWEILVPAAAKPPIEQVESTKPIGQVDEPKQ